MKNWDVRQNSQQSNRHSDTACRVGYFFFGTFQQDEIRFVAFAACVAIGMRIMKDDRSDK